MEPCAKAQPGLHTVRNPPVYSHRNHVNLTPGWWSNCLLLPAGVILLKAETRERIAILGVKSNRYLCMDLEGRPFSSVSRVLFQFSFYCEIILRPSFARTKEVTGARKTGRSTHHFQHLPSILRTTTSKHMKSSCKFILFWVPLRWDSHVFQQSASNKIFLPLKRSTVFAFYAHQNTATLGWSQINIAFLSIFFITEIIILLCF